MLPSPPPPNPHSMSKHITESAHASVRCKCVAYTHILENMLSHTSLQSVAEGRSGHKAAFFLKHTLDIKASAITK